MVAQVTRIPLVLAALMAASVLAACADLPAQMRRVTYPPNFKYVERDQVQSAMWQMADGVNRLDVAMRQPPPVDEARRQQIRELLAQTDAAAAALEAHGRPTNHPLLADRLDAFRREIALARAGVDLEPPSYYLVGSVAGACLGCHDTER